MRKKYKNRQCVRKKSFEETCTRRDLDLLIHQLSKLPGVPQPLNPSDLCIQLKCIVCEKNARFSLAFQHQKTSVCRFFERLNNLPTQIKIVTKKTQKKLSSSFITTGQFHSFKD